MQSAIAKAPKFVQLAAEQGRFKASELEQLRANISNENVTMAAKDFKLGAERRPKKTLAKTLQPQGTVDPISEKSSESSDSDLKEDESIKSSNQISSQSIDALQDGQSKPQTGHSSNDNTQ